MEVFIFLPSRTSTAPRRKSGSLLRPCLCGVAQLAVLHLAMVGVMEVRIILLLSLLCLQVVVHDQGIK